MATLNQWVEGARPRTLPAAIAPVLVGTGAAYAMEKANPGYALLALIVALFLQIGVNYANDYSDGIRGTDEDRVGPVRLVGQGLANPGNVKLAAFGCFFIAAFVGLALVTLSNTPWLLLVGVAAILAAWFYTGGKRPYGYMGLGEVFVFVFFGLVAVLGTTYTQAHTLSPSAWAGSIGVGAIACAILVTNNLRDIPTDVEAGKHTLAVRLGDKATRTFYVLLIAVSVAAVAVCTLFHVAAAAGFVALIAAIPPVLRVMRGATGRDLVPALAGTGRYQLLYGLLLGGGLYAAHLMH
ncbi:MULTISPECIES: 1,4-dihydroxy-2-naphthoate polyprenyltransferase [Dermacoccus]|uniref:1,4-dihydroxy-2-naphthoate polyprenyltransferase n=1 Tax=Dermacoccus TaxID=57495 RepID=UPI0007816883|nr:MULTISPECIES: 1,4-dihydroxy-2-naphthoate polyprenyltransferase [Dermacoccus]